MSRNSMVILATIEQSTQIYQSSILRCESLQTEVASLVAAVGFGILEFKVQTFNLKPCQAWWLLHDKSTGYLKIWLDRLFWFARHTQALYNGGNNSKRNELPV